MPVAIPWEQPLCIGGTNGETDRIEIDAERFEMLAFDHWQDIRVRPEPATT